MLIQEAMRRAADVCRGKRDHRGVHGQQLTGTDRELPTSDPRGSGGAEVYLGRGLDYEVSDGGSSSAEMTS